MRKPPKVSDRTDDAADKVPPGGRALARIQQDRKARGLGEITRSATLSLEDNNPPEPGRTQRARRAKPAGRP